MTRRAIAKERHLIRCLFLPRLLLGHNFRREKQRQRREVARERATQRGLMQSRRRVIHGKDRQSVDLARPPMDARDRFTRQELTHRVPPERHDHLRLQDLEMTPEPDIAGPDLLGQRVAVLRRTMPHDVRDEHLAPVETDVRQELVQQLPGRPDEGTSLEILVVARGFAEEEDPRLCAPLPGHGLPRAAVERTGRARPDLVGEHAQVVLHSR